jgi:hypothetical protein
VISLFLLTIQVHAQGRLIPNPIRNIPRWVRNEFAAKGMNKQFTIIFRLYPYYLRGDFNGDGRRDYAIQVEEKSSGKDGIAIFHTHKAQSLITPVSIIGAGRSLDNLSSDLSWVDIWTKISRNHRAAVQNLLHIKGDVIELEKRKGRTGVIYWDGKRYSWKELGKVPPNE